MLTRAMPPSQIDQALDQSLATVIENKDAYVRDPSKDFTRDSKLGIVPTVCTILNMNGDCIRGVLRKTPCTMIKKRVYSVLKKHQLPKSEGKIATSSAFVQRRKLLSYRLFEDAFKEFVRLTQSDDGTFYGYILAAGDGSDLMLPSDPKEVEYHMDGGVKPYNQIHLDCLFNIGSRTFIAASTRGKHKNDERAVAIELMDACPLKNVIMTNDRGYESFNYMAHVQEKEWFYLLRAKDVDSNGIASGLDLPSTPEFDEFIDLTLMNKNNNEAWQLSLSDRNKYKYISGKDFDYFPDRTTRNDPMCTYHLPFRCVRLHIKDNKYEVLLTNLPRDKFPPEILKQAYHLRWDNMPKSAYCPLCRDTKNADIKYQKVRLYKAKTPAS